MRHLRLRWVGLAAALLFGAVGGFVIRGGGIHTERAEAMEPPVAAVTTAATASTTATPTRIAPPDFSAIVQQYGPAVVNVSVTGTSHAQAQMELPGPFGKLDPNDPFSQFFKHFQIPQGDVLTHGVGSGFIIKPDGYILTNAHVVDHASDVDVKLTDGRQYKAKVIGSDKASDVAVLKIDARDLPTVATGSAADVQVGQWVLAIGSPFGLENTATAGIVSAKARSLPDEGYIPFLQTDVAVNPGNSGGPLFDVAGKVIGINSQIYSNSGGYQGLSFAIPIDVAMKVERQLVATGHVSRGRLGVTIQDVSQGLAQSFGLDKPKGALVSSVEKSGPAAKAGIQPGDVIMKFEGRDVARSSDLPLMVADAAPGTRVRLDVWRKGGERTLEATLGGSTSSEVATTVGDHDHGRLGLKVRPLTPDEQQEDQVKGGLLVEEVSGPAARAGLQPGDVVLSLNAAPVKNAEEMRNLLAHSGKEVALLVQRDGNRIFVPVDLG
jgi:serine protease Do